MALHRLGPPEDLVLRLRNVVGADSFVETGTYRGGTSAWAAEHFRRVVTMEASPEFAARARARFTGSNVEVLEGDSAELLKGVLAAQTAPCVVWLDAHWSGGETAGRDFECPLLAEIDALNESALDHAILIDDARLFSYAPPEPHDPEAWPSLLEVVPRLGEGTRRYVAIFDDVIIAVPAAIRGVIDDYCRSHARRTLLRPRWRQRVARLASRFA